MFVCVRLYLWVTCVCLNVGPFVFDHVCLCVSVCYCVCVCMYVRVCLVVYVPCVLLFVFVSV